MQAVAVGVHGDHRREALHAKGPDGLGAAELLQVHPRDLGHALGQDLGRAADGVQVHAADLLARLEGLGPHTPLADHRPDLELLDDVALVRLFPGGGGGAWELDPTPKSLHAATKTWHSRINK